VNEKKINMKDLADCAKQGGYEFIAILKDGGEIKTKVEKDKNGLHFFREFSRTLGWIEVFKI